MGNSMADELEKAGFKLSETEEKKVKDQINLLKKKTRRSVCKKCEEPIQFLPDGKKMAPHDLDSTPHWQTCTHASFAQRRAAPGILKKLAILFVVKHGIDLESEAGLDPKETQIVSAILEKTFREVSETKKGLTTEKVMKAKTEEELGELVDKNATKSEEVKDKEGLSFEPESCDSVGDPDEERAPSEESVTEASEKLEEVSLKDGLDIGVEKVISEPIQAFTEPREGEPVAEKE